MKAHRGSVILAAGLAGTVLLMPAVASTDVESLRMVARALRFVAQSEIAVVSADVLVGPVLPYSPPDESSRKVKPGEPIYLTELIGDEAMKLYEKLLSNPALGAFAGIEQRALASGKILTFFNREPVMPHRVYTVAVNSTMLHSRDYPASLVRPRPRKLSETLRDAVRKYLTQYPGGNVDPAPPLKGVVSGSPADDAEAPPT
ncbi:MAG: hypothetical protein V2G42_02600 [bacterium JZ-2024 1]